MKKISLALAFLLLIAGVCPPLSGAGETDIPSGEEKSGNAPSGMALIVGVEFTAGLDPDVGMAECLKYTNDCQKGWFVGEQPHRESLRTFSMDKYEVTQGDFERVMGNNPSHFKGSNLPAESVTWHEAKDYCQKVGKRLPTEWEWEYAAKGDRNTKYAWGDNGNDADRYAWYKDNSGRTTHPVGQKEPNGYGLYDMAGNVSEWTASDYDSKFKVLRGGSWLDNPSNMRSATRGLSRLGDRHYTLGFRCVQ